MRPVGHIEGEVQVHRSLLLLAFLPPPLSRVLKQSVTPTCCFEVVEEAIEGLPNSPAEHVTGGVLVGKVVLLRVVLLQREHTVCYIAAFTSQAC
jgi:hypothetical protein